MLNPFPQLLYWMFFAPTLLRLAAAGVIIYMAYIHHTRRSELKTLISPIVGRNAPYVIGFVVIVETIVGLLLLVGLYTQWAAIVGILLSLRSLLAIPHRALSPFDRTADALLLFVCLSLLLTGAGAFAFDIPL